MVVSSTVTGGAGDFEFRQVPLGTYQIIAFSGMDTTEARIEVSSLNGPINLRLSGPKEPPHDTAGRNSISVAQYRVPEKAREEFRKAREASLKGKTEETLAHIAKALEIYPQYADALTLRAILKLSVRDTDSAVADLQEAIQCDGNYAMAYLVLGSAFNLAAKFDDAIIALQRGQTLSPDAWQGYFELGKAYAGKTEYESALHQLDHAQTLAPPDYPLIRLVRAHVFMQLSRFADAVTDLQVYLAKSPQGADAELAQKMLESAKASLEAQK
jgi:tetratricopeptide (TPR) repeat protein